MAHQLSCQSCRSLYRFSPEPRWRSTTSATQRTLGPITQQQLDTLLDNGRPQAAVKGTPDEIDFCPVVKLFNLCGAATWLVTEIEPLEPTIAWGLCDLGMGCPEFGTVSLAELQAFHGPFGFGIEHDLHFVADKPNSAYIEKANRHGRIVA